MAISKFGSIVRKRSASHKVYIPNKARNNQYLVAQFKLTDDLIEQFNDKLQLEAVQPYFNLYQFFAEQFFTVCEKYDLKNINFIANNKRNTVRYGEEQRVWQTDTHIQFSYNPAVHTGCRKFIDGKNKVKKITLLILATGSELRAEAAAFHERTQQAVQEFAQICGIAAQSIRLRDHQHLTFDLFASDKGNRGTQSHQFRPIPTRYAAGGIEIPEPNNALTYVMANLTIDHQLIKQIEIDEQAQDPYNPLYSVISNAFTQACQQFNLNNCALVANGLFPIIRSSEREESWVDHEFQMLGYNPEQRGCGILSRWDPEKLVDECQLIFMATHQNRTDRGYGRFVNQIEQALKLTAQTLGLEPSKDELIIRIHQHAAYDLNQSL